jgi:hypothetical protein
MSELIKQTIDIGRQSVLYTEVSKIADKKVKVEIKSDSYDFQSYARVSVFNENDLEWKKIDSVHFSNMNTKEGLDSYPQARKLSLGMETDKHKNFFIAEFWKDRDTLVNMARGILT